MLLASDENYEAEDKEKMGNLHTAVIESLMNSPLSIE
jgi:hypothetical protein